MDLCVPAGPELRGDRLEAQPRARRVPQNNDVAAVTAAVVCPIKPAALTADTARLRCRLHCTFKLAVTRTQTTTTIDNHTKMCTLKTWFQLSNHDFSTSKPKSLDKF